jgi:methionine-rich copper-binding protein CopC
MAHAELVRTDLPGPGLASLPERVVMSFSEDLDNGTSATLLDPSGVPADGVSAAIDRPHLRQLIVGLPPAVPGPYTLEWTSVSAEDGHQQSSFFGLIAGGQPLSLTDPVAGAQLSGPSDIGVNLRVATDEVGVHRWSVSIDRTSPDSIQRVQLRFTPLGTDLGTENLTAQLDPISGAFTVGEPIALVGQWRVEVGVRRSSVPDDVRVPFTFTASQTEAIGPRGN